ncbi:hypothetical protein FA13DRAFT_1715068 [Coprinellus micaceus]|uniref:Uncharacterized protein n=1 Tax=Coprinellus micaceus TaxID=71717 RepID=A0A4Y7SQB8_COPMI|nr:hypothetical protein FA13DRAFT_1715068 [Coprinellus micaceus]
MANTQAWALSRLAASLCAEIVEAELMLGLQPADEFDSQAVQIPRRSTRIYRVGVEGEIVFSTFSTSVLFLSPLECKALVKSPKSSNMSEPVDHFADEQTKPTFYKNLSDFPGSSWIPDGVVPTFMWEVYPGSWTGGGDPRMWRTNEPASCKIGVSTGELPNHDKAGVLKRLSDRKNPERTSQDKTVTSRGSWEAPSGGTIRARSLG